jgi:hypothetical protein
MFDANASVLVGILLVRCAWGYRQYRLLSAMLGLFLGWRPCIPKNTEAEYIPDILHVLGSGSLLQIVKV